eukprot:TRINITY_DN7483_c0_g2_i4.p2 TRINITY_DN7483_c0_g2~~TRINITY_DN7483_c0_g2_i4.p2  ORF type:complete len:292 (-),score=-23.98 TRINITY_DN7483_c0_g2_i4:79-870(-)
MQENYKITNSTDQLQTYVSQNAPFQNTLFQPNQKWPSKLRSQTLQRQYKTCQKITQYVKLMPNKNAGSKTLLTLRWKQVLTLKYARDIRVKDIIVSNQLLSLQLDTIIGKIKAICYKLERKLVLATYRMHVSNIFFNIMYLYSLSYFQERLKQSLQCTQMCTNKYTSNKYAQYVSTMLLLQCIELSASKYVQNLHYRAFRYIQFKSQLEYIQMQTSKQKPFALLKYTLNHNQNANRYIHLTILKTPQEYLKPWVQRIWIYIYS